MYQTLKDRLALAALREISHSDFSMISEADKEQLYALVERFAEVVKGDAVVNAITPVIMRDLDIEPGTLLSRKAVTDEQVVIGLVEALFIYGNKSRWK